ncbi:hypothetical protein VTH06DRAFT_8393 [Thermothelomyces fergusii]
MRLTLEPSPVRAKSSHCDPMLHRSPKPIHPVVHAPAVMTTHYEEVETAGPRAPLGVPVRNPFLNRLETVLRYRSRPVPVTFLRFAFSDQLSTTQPGQPWI